jgi:hypothetical protein
MDKQGCLRLGKLSLTRLMGLRTRERDGVEIYDSNDDAYLQYLNTEHQGL